MTRVIGFLLKRLDLPAWAGFFLIVVMTPKHFAPVTGPQHSDSANDEFRKFAQMVAVVTH